MGGASLIVVRPALAIVRGLPFLVVGFGAFALAALSDSPIGGRLVIAGCGIVMFAAVIVGLLRAMVLARPGQVRAAFSKSWLDVEVPSEIVVADEDGRWWPVLVAESNGVVVNLVTVAGPIWLGGSVQHDLALDRACRTVRAAAFPADSQS